MKKKRYIQMEFRSSYLQFVLAHSLTTMVDDAVASDVFVVTAAIVVIIIMKVYNGHCLKRYMDTF